MRVIWISDKIIDSIVLATVKRRNELNYNNSGRKKVAVKVVWTSSIWNILVKKGG